MLVVKMKDAAAPDETLTIKTRDEAEAAMAILAALQLQVAAELNDQNARLIIAHKNDATIRELHVRQERFEQALCEWATANRSKEFGSKKELELRQGWLRFRLGGRSVKFIEGWTEDLVLAKLRKIKSLAVYVRTQCSIDKQTILRDSRTDNPYKPPLKAEELARAGLEIAQHESFETEIKQETLPEAAALAVTEFTDC